MGGLDECSVGNITRAGMVVTTACCSSPGSIHRFFCLARNSGVPHSAFLRHVGNHLPRTDRSTRSWSRSRPPVPTSSNRAGTSSRGRWSVEGGSNSVPGMERHCAIPFDPQRDGVGSRGLRRGTHHLLTHPRTLRPAEVARDERSHSPYLRRHSRCSSPPTTLALTHCVKNDEWRS